MAVFHNILFVMGIAIVRGIFVDPGNPYSDGPLGVSKITFSETVDHSPKHCVVYYPQQSGEYSTVYFVGGLYSIVLAEYYSEFLRKIASHGFFVFGIDYDFPGQATGAGHGFNYSQDINIYFEQIDFLKTHLTTTATPRYDVMGLLCHSSGCDTTLKMIQEGRIKFKATGFLEPVSFLILFTPKVNDVPALVYGTEMAEVGPLKCNIPGMDYKKLYPEWKCPKVEIEVARFGHCDLLDTYMWEACHHICTTSDTNTTAIAHYRQVAQGLVSGFFMTTLQGRPDAIGYITDEAKVPIKLLTDKSDLEC